VTNDSISIQSVPEDRKVIKRENKDMFHVASSTHTQFPSVTDVRSGAKYLLRTCAWFRYCPPSRPLPVAANKEIRGNKNRDKCKLQRIEGTFTERDNEMKSKKKKEKKKGGK
jgi:hypothetical protein